tara:strand:- start:388 stop:594 length:207 start_codon:yes stop_codon:yes gene_type:complete
MNESPRTNSDTYAALLRHGQASHLPLQAGEVATYAAPLGPRLVKAGAQLLVVSTAFGAGLILLGLAVG